MEESIRLQLENRVYKIEEGHYELTSAMGSISKDMHVLSSTLLELKDVMKSLAQRELEFQLFRQEFAAHTRTEEVTIKDSLERIKVLENKDALATQSLLTLHGRVDSLLETTKDMRSNINKGVWMVLGAFILGAVNLLVKVPL